MRVPRGLPRVLLASVTVFVLVACGDPGSEGSTPSSSVGVAGTPESLQFQGTLVGGGTLDGATLSGRPVLLWFWAPT